MDGDIIRSFQNCNADNVSQKKSICIHHSNTTSQILDYPRCATLLCSKFFWSCVCQNSVKNLKGRKSPWRWTLSQNAYSVALQGATDTLSACSQSVQRLTPLVRRRLAVMRLLSHIISFFKSNVNSRRAQINKQRDGSKACVFCCK